MHLANMKIGELRPNEIRELVRRKYSEVATNTQTKFMFRVGTRYACDLGYPSETLKELPEELKASFTGVSSYLALSEESVRGEIILELGAGAGLDAALLARQVGPTGKVIGLDLSLEMARKGAAGLRSLGFSNFRFLQSQAEEIPLPDSSVDRVVSNGIFNLSPEKERIVGEIHRVLKPQGRLHCSEIVLPRDPTPEERNNQDDWFK